MKNGYKILWTENALEELENTIDYLQKNFSEKEIKKLATAVEKMIATIAHNPYTFSQTYFKESVRKVVVTRYNTLYYQIKNDNVEILSFFSNRQSPDKVKL